MSKLDINNLKRIKRIKKGKLFKKGLALITAAITIAGSANGLCR